MKEITKEKAQNQRSSFSGKLGYVMAVAGSAVGLGNIWRFPYLAAKYGGGIFLLVYLVLVLTFGYTMIVTETALGRMTRKSPIGAYGAFGKGTFFKAGGWLNAIIPMLIAPYYCVIGGWVLKYLFEYLCGHASQLAADGYFNAFVSNSAHVELFFVIFAAATLGAVISGVKKGIEALSKIMMPILVGLAFLTAVYSVTRPGAMAGVKYFFIPNFKDFSAKTVVAALGQMFYSLSIAMGIQITYGSYLKKDVDIEKSTKQVELFDTAIAILAGLMIIPAVFSFSGGTPESLQAGPSLMFVTLPKVFSSMGLSTPAGILFFVLVFFAAITSSISLAETSVSTFEDQLGWSRKKSTLVFSVVLLALGSASALGFGVLDFINIPKIGTVLDFFDFITNSAMMPLAALCTCVLAVRYIGLKKVCDEIELSSAFKRKKLYCFFIKYLAPVCIVIILLTSIASVFGLLSL